MKPLWIAITLLSMITVTAQARDSRPGDFAYGIPLQTGGTAALYQCTLPDIVYRTVKRGDLGDLCVFNSQGEVVPFSLSRSSAPSPTIPESRKINLFPVSGSRVQESGSVSLIVKKGNGGSIVSVASSAPSTRPTRITAYLLDASSLKVPLKDLTLEWEEQSAGTAAKLKVEGSDNLEDWTLIVPSAIIISLRYGDNNLERRVIELNCSKMKYYRLSSASDAEIPRLTSVVARLSTSASELPRHWASGNTTRHSSRSGDYLFSTGGLMPVDRIRVHLPQENTLIQASFFSRATEKDSWKQGPSVLLYRLRIKGEKVTSPDIVLPASSDQYRLMRIDQGSGGIGKGLPVVELGWVPAQILFLARGERPFQLAFGSGKLGNCAHGGSTLFRQFSDQHKEKYVAEDAIPGPPAILGGKAALHKPLIPYDAETAVLWSLLLLGVGILAWMAQHLHRQMNSTKGDKN
ncbi:MAG: DUF3999 domain-containing protein [Geobacteraceae bacterium]|nr:DUF3999 domain-containing protein [Geobacteraceae bacterium]